MRLVRRMTPLLVNIRRLCRVAVTLAAAVILSRLPFILYLFGPNKRYESAVLCVPTISIMPIGRHQSLKPFNAGDNRKCKVFSVVLEIISDYVISTNISTELLEFI